MTAAGDIPSDRNPKFPAGMRVLAVDDDPTCLKILDSLLRKCQYHVTTTSHAVTALKLLRQNKNMFDLVITDVRMPDMDGFKLLELVGLEMDLPVIMLSAYGDKDQVMKGISHGACDYLLKPVRIEELKIIWQHVIRRKKIDIKDRNSFDKSQDNTAEVEGFTRETETYQSDKITRKRKDQIVDEYEENDQDGDNEDSSWQKKPRLVWTPELHRQFVAAINHLGLDKAVPKRILEVMNVENVTRENVASHLQKYRGYMKRIEAERNQANMVSALGSSGNGFANLHSLAMSGHAQNAIYSSVPQGGVLSRLNSPRLSFLGQSSSGTQGDRSQTFIRADNQNGNILQGVPISLGLDQLQRNRSVSHIGDLSVSCNESNIYGISNVFPNRRAMVGSSINPFLDVQSNPLVVENHLQNSQKGVVFRNNSINAECPESLDYRRFDDSWLNVVESSQNLTNSCTSESMNLMRKRDLGEYNSYMSTMNNGSMDSSLIPHYDTGLVGQRLEPGSLVGQPNFLDPLYLQQNEPVAQTTTELNYGSITGQRNPNISHDHRKDDSLEDLVTEMLGEDESMLITKTINFGCDTYPHSNGPGS